MGRILRSWLYAGCVQNKSCSLLIGCASCFCILCLFILLTVVGLNETSNAPVAFELAKPAILDGSPKQLHESPQPVQKSSPESKRNPIHFNQQSDEKHERNDWRNFGIWNYFKPGLSRAKRLTVSNLRETETFQKSTLENYEEYQKLLLHTLNNQTTFPEAKSVLSKTSEISKRSANADQKTVEEIQNGNQTDLEKPQPLFPEDLFTLEERQRGAVFLHMMGVIYMFVALAIVCDEFFVPSLDVIIEKMHIPDDVAGATFMAAGGSAPELFTSVIGVFVSFDDVGIGTIVGSAVFNILFVIGMCALFSKTILTLTWWPLFRDCTFYSISLIALVLFFMDGRIVWWEAALLLSIYAAYVGFMRWNEKVERTVKGFLYRNTMPRISSSDHLVGTNNASNRGPASQVSVSSGGSSSATGPLVGSNTLERNRVASAGIRGSKFRHGLLTLMIHSIDPMHDGGHVDDKANKLHAIASLRVLLDATKEQTINNGRETNEEPKVCDPEATSSGNPISATMRPATGNAAVTALSIAEQSIVSIESCTNAAVIQQDIRPTNSEAVATDEEESSQPLDLSWPEGTRKRLTYIFLAPILWPLWLTLPDTRTPQGKRFFVVTFIGSILWIAGYSYLMVWWANLTGETMSIPPEVMGLTFLAAGTSIPDLITSVIVARKGLGDMAVSSSVGSNIFDICVGLPLPWLLFCILKGIPVEVNSSGMACSVLILFGMLCFVVLSIACFRWKMNKALGFTMFMFYFVFVAVSLGFEYGTIVCPV